MAFDSAGAGFSRGFARGATLALQRRQVRAQEEKAEAIRQKALRDSTQARFKAVQENVRALTKAAQEAAADPTKGGPEFAQRLIAAAQQSVEFEKAQRARLNLQTRLAAREAGQIIPPDQEALLPSPDDVAPLQAELDAVSQGLAGIGEAATPEATGERAAREKLAENAAILDVPVRSLSSDQRQRIAGQEPEPIKWVVFFDPKERRSFAIESTDAAGQRKAVENGAVPIPASVQAATPEEAIGITKDERKEFRALEATTRIALSETARLREQIRGGKTATGLLSTVVRGLSAAAGNALQTARLFGQDDDALLDPSRYELGQFGEVAAGSQAFRSNAINLAYILARNAEPGGRLSEGDIQRQVDRLAASVGDVNQVLAALDEVDRQVKNAFRIQHSILSREDASIGPLPEDIFELAPEKRELQFDPETEALIKELLGNGDR